MGPRWIVRGGLRPHFGQLRIEEAEALLQGLYLVDVLQLRAGYPPISQALHRSASGRRRLWYLRLDASEHWRTIRELWTYGGGDCEDLAAAVAAELTVSGTLAIPRLLRVRPGLVHAVVQVRQGPLAGQYLDPSKTGGMGEA